jgi:hypothetical protein
VDACYALGMPRKQIEIELNVKITNERGAWVILRAYPHTSGRYEVYGYESWSPTYCPSLGPVIGPPSTHMNRSKIEKQMRSFLRNR